MCVSFGLCQIVKTALETQNCSKLFELPRNAFFTEPSIWTRNKILDCKTTTCNHALLFGYEGLGETSAVTANDGFFLLFSILSFYGLTATIHFFIYYCRHGPIAILDALISK